jgi:PAS domain S-box-containing protein
MDLIHQRYQSLAQRSEEFFRRWRDQLPAELEAEFGALYTEMQALSDDLNRQRAPGSEGEGNQRTEQMAYHAHLLEYVHDAIIATDLNFRIIVWNRAAEELYGWQAKEAIGQKLSDVIQSDLLHTDLDNTLQSLMQQGHYRYDVAQTTRSGERIFVDAAGVILTDDNHQITGYLSASRDITARKQAEVQAVSERNRAETLAAESKQRAAELDTVFKSLAEAVIVYDSKGIVVRANPAAVEIMGMDPIGMNMGGIATRLRAQDDDGSFLTADEMPASEALNGGKVVNRRLNLVNSRNEQIHVLVSASPLPPIDDEPTGVVAVWYNITEQVRTRREIEEERALLKAIFEYAPSGIVVTNRQGRVILTNPEADRIYSRSVPYGEEFESHERLEICHLDGTPVNPRDLPLTRATLDGEVNINMDLAIRLPNGNLRPILVNSTPIRDQKGKVSGAVAVFQDMTDRKRAEQQLRESEERFKVALKNSPITVYTTDRELRYTWIHNPPLGFSPNQMIGKRDDEIFSAAQAEMMVAFKRKVLESGTGARQEIILKLEGQTIIFDMTAEPIYDGKAEIEGLTVAAVDMTEQRQLEAEMQRSAMRLQMQHYLTNQRELERMHIARDLHDGPLQDLIAVTFGMQGVIDDAEGTSLSRTLQKMQDELQRQIANLRSFSYELRPPMLNNFSLERTIRSHAEGFVEKYPHLKVHLDLTPDERKLPDPVRTALFRIYQEALNNVLKHAQSDEVYVRLEVGERIAQLEVLDKGIGFEMPTDWLILARKGHLGLVGIQERVDAIRGRMKIASRPGRGTQLLVSVPYRLDEIAAKGD